MRICELLTLSFALTFTPGSARRRGTTDSWSFIAAKFRGVSPSYRDRGTNDERRGARRENKEEEGVREHRKRRGIFVDIRW